MSMFDLLFSGLLGMLAVVAFIFWIEFEGDDK